VKSSPIRDLARRYAAGELSQENYRGQRRALIDAVTSGKQALSYRDDNSQGGGRPGNLKLVALAASAVLVMVVVFAVSWKASNNRHDQSKAESSAAPAVASVPTPGPALVRGFVETNDWSDPSLEDFTRQWHGLNTEEQMKARASLLFPRLESELRQQITSEKAMASAAAAPQGNPHLLHLQKMAQTLGLTDTH
jgi:hypothetical protein